MLPMFRFTAFLGMISLIWIALTQFVPIVAGQSPGQFFNPPKAVEGTHDYSTNPVYLLGETQTIKFTTGYSNYSINLWQEILGQGAASKGQGIFSTENGAVTQFDWQVQVYQFDLSASSVFFLWLTSSTLNSDGTEPMSVTSHYFNISSNPSPSGSSSSTSSSTRTDLPTQLSTSSLLPTTTTTTTSLPIATSSQNPAPGGLNTGAKAGIGVGASLAGVAIITLSWLLFRRSKQKHSYTAPDYPQASENLAPGDVTMIYNVPPQGFKAPTVPAELG
ncbi:hypothetical protein EV127DRAFT_486010 [Xylaria flabelliformis]|nr:hypothetical protein EV127DRAFT_486010 [Xylaria flabelliformis]